MSLQDFMLRKMVQSKMKGVPIEQQEKILNSIKNNPEFFQKVGLEIQDMTKKGMDQMSAVKNVLEKYKDQFQKLT